MLQESACAPHLGGADELAAPYQYFTAYRGLEAGTGAVRRSGGQAVGCEARVRPEGAQRGREALVNRAVGCAQRSEGGDRGRDGVRHLVLVPHRASSGRPPHDVEAQSLEQRAVVAPRRLVAAEGETRRVPSVQA